MRQLAFTLIELLVVTTLVAIIAGILVLRLDSFTDQGRLRNAASQIGAVYRLTRTLCMTTGSPAWIDYHAEGRVVVRRAVVQDGRVAWTGGDGFDLGGGARLIGLLDEDHPRLESASSSKDGPIGSVSLDTQGVGSTHGILLSVRQGHLVGVVLVDGLSGMDRLIEGVQEQTFDFQKTVAEFDEAAKRAGID